MSTEQPKGAMSETPSPLKPKRFRRHSWDPDTATTVWLALEMEASYATTWAVYETEEGGERLAYLHPSRAPSTGRSGACASKVGSGPCGPPPTTAPVGTSGRRRCRPPTRSADSCQHDRTGGCCDSGQARTARA